MTGSHLLRPLLLYSTSLRKEYLQDSMRSTFVLVALAAVTFVSAANDTICGTSIYPSLACLTSNRGAASVCAKAPHQTFTLTVTTTTLDVSSVTITRDAQSQVTVHSTETEMSTKTVTR